MKEVNPINFLYEQKKDSHSLKKSVKTCLFDIFGVVLGNILKKRKEFFLHTMLAPRQHYPKVPHFGLFLELLCQNALLHTMLSPELC